MTGISGTYNNRPLWDDFTLETGYESTTNLTNQEQDVFHMESDSAIWVLDPEAGNRFYGQYRSEALTAQGYRLPSWVVNLGFRQDFWKKRISFVATVSDLFNSQAWKVNTSTPVLVQESTRRHDARVIYGGFVFNFGTNGKKSKEPKFEFDTGGE